MCLCIRVKKNHTEREQKICISDSPVALVCNVICNITRSDGPGIKLGFRTRPLSGSPIRSVALRRFTVLREKDIKHFAGKRPSSAFFSHGKRKRCDLLVRDANKLVRDTQVLSNRWTLCETTSRKYLLITRFVL